LLGRVHALKLANQHMKNVAFRHLILKKDEATDKVGSLVLINSV